MGGRESQGYRMFQELTVKAFLAIRPHTEQLVNTVRLMLETALPSFKGEGTIDRLRQRFQPDLTERRAAEFMIAVVKDAHENKRSNLYDEFQRLTNVRPATAPLHELAHETDSPTSPLQGIPYAG